MKKNIKGFTLVELIVSIVIISILAIIGFVGYSNYMVQARDASRISNLNSIESGLEKYRLLKNTLPIPDDKVNIKVEGKLIGYQGYAGKNVLEIIEYSTKGVDPKDGKYYSYYMNKSKKYFQLMAFLEEKPNVNVGFINKIYAGDYKNRIPFVIGENLGIITDEDNNPINEVVSNTFDINSDLSTSIKLYFNGDKYVYGTGAKINEFKKLLDINRVGGKNWDIYNNQFVNPNKSGVCGDLNGADLVSLPTDQSQLCFSGDATQVIDNGLGNYYLWSCKGKNNGNTIKCRANHRQKTCDLSTKPTDNGNIIYTENPQNYNVAYTKGGTECGYDCKPGIGGNLCDVKYLTIPNGTSSTNLKDFINANASGFTKIVITNNGTIGTVTTGDLTGLDVELINNGEIQGQRTSGVGGNALTVTSPLKLTNNGWIRGAGGRGGNGGKGANKTTSSTQKIVQTYGWEVRIKGKDRTGAWPVCGSLPKSALIVGGSFERNNNAPNITSKVVSGRTYYRSTWRGYRGACGGTARPTRDSYYWKTVTTTYYGGAGGAGGYGRGFNAAKTNGSVGSASSPAGGYSGGAGGAGGDWGQAGASGERGAGGGASGTAGSAGGKSIVGTSKLKPGSIQGNLSGNTSN